MRQMVVTLEQMVRTKKHQLNPIIMLSAVMPVYQQFMCFKTKNSVSKCMMFSFVCLKIDM